jgi:hypothetical protein
MLSGKDVPTRAPYASDDLRRSKMLVVRIICRVSQASGQNPTKLGLTRNT